MFVAGMVAIEVMKADPAKKECVERVQAVAGLSLGEYTAICAAGILDFSTCLKLVKIRGEAMQKATELRPQAMCSVAGLDRQILDKCCAEAKSMNLDGKDPVCQVANLLFPAGFTVAGTKNTIDQLCKIALKARALQAKVIKTGGAFHTPLMASAESELAAAIESVRDKMKPPRCSIYFNVNAKKIAPGTDPSTFADLMKKQLTNEVLWEPTMKQMIIDGVKDFYECGPLKQLKAMLKRIDQDAFKRTENISV
jgi:[acyl-carrier-protein] S-malonyltransferase